MAPAGPPERWEPSNCPLPAALAALLADGTLAAVLLDPDAVLTVLAARSHGDGVELVDG